MKKQSRMGRIASIDALIDEAYALAQRRLQQHVAAGGAPTEMRVCKTFDLKGRQHVKTDYKHFFLIEFYHEAMNELTRAAGLRDI